MNLKKNKLVLFISNTLIIHLLITACEIKQLKPAKPAQNKTNDGNGTKPDPKPIDKEMSCEEHWDEFISLNPKDYSSTFQDSQVMKVKDQTTILTQSITEKVILENTEAQLTWKKNINTLSPEKGTTTSVLTIEKNHFIDLCSKGFNFIYNDRPSDKKPESQKKGVLKFNNKDYEVVYELFNFSVNSDPINKHILETWVGITPPYEGLLFNSKRVYYRSAKEGIAEITVTKELLHFKLPSDDKP